MRWLYGLALTALGWALAVGVPWARHPMTGLPFAVPLWVAPALPLVLALLFGLYLALLTSLRATRSLMAFQAAVALAVVALPFAYAYGLAARYGLPESGGPLGTLLAQPVVRGMAAIWLALATVAACQRPVRTVPQTPTGARVAHADTPIPSYWAPAPVNDPAAAIAPAPYAPTPYTPTRTTAPADVDHS